MSGREKIRERKATWDSFNFMCIDAQAILLLYNETTCCFKVHTGLAHALGTEEEEKEWKEEDNRKKRKKRENVSILCGGSERL